MKQEEKLATVLAAERRALRQRHETRSARSEPTLEGWKGTFGIALSGGGIRSATVSLGFLEVLNRAGLLRAADYLSTVSGGGYLGAYVQAALHQGPSDPYATLFSPDAKKRLLDGRDYLARGAGIAARLRLLRFIAALLSTVILNFVWVIALLVFLGACLRVPWDWANGEKPPEWTLLATATALVLGWHFAGHVLRRARLWSAGVLNWLEAVLLAAAAVLASEPLAAWAARFPRWATAAVATAIASLRADNQSVDMLRRIADGAGTLDTNKGLMIVASAVVFVVAGLLADPNRLTMHSFYRARLAEAYLAVASKAARHMRLRDLASTDGWTVGPYPLINGCVNLVRDPELAGARANDYFLFSPLYCGSKLTGYRPTNEGSYVHLELATAMTASGAAVNPSMGSRTSPLLALVMSLLNLRLGYWAIHRTSLAWLPVFWPRHLIAETFQQASNERSVLDVADGGFIENLGVFELLRRECRLIVALDAACDAKYDFDDLRNLVMRARQELGIQIDFLQQPEAIIRPAASTGYSASHFVIARARGIPGSDARKDGYEGLIVYAKSSLRAQKSWKDLGGDKSLLYKTYHPTFPHESTADQFFDEAQWMAYYNLGRFIAGDALGVDVREDSLQEMNVNDLFTAWNALDDNDALAAHLKQPERSGETASDERRTRTR